MGLVVRSGCWGLGLGFEKRVRSSEVVRTVKGLPLRGLR